MQLDCNIDDESKIRIREFFKQKDPHEYIREFLSKYLYTNNSPQKENQMPSLFQPNPKPSNRMPISNTNESTSIPSLRVEFTKGSSFDDFSGITSTYFCFDFEVLGKHHFVKHISACQNPIIGQTIISPIPSDNIEYLLTTPIRISVSTESPNRRFIGFSTISWNHILSNRTESSSDIISSQGDVVGVVDYTLTLNNIDYRLLIKHLENISDNNSSNQTLSDFRKWYRELKQHVNIEMINISLLNSITPMYSRKLITPGHCFRYVCLFDNICSPKGSSIIPNWAVIGSKFGDETEKLNVLVSFLRGFNLRSFVVVAKPHSFAVSLSFTPPVIFDVNNRNFGKNIPKETEHISYLYNEEMICVNLCPDESIDWDIDNPIKWKTFHVQKDVNVFELKSDESEKRNESEIEIQLMRMIELHRTSVGLTTKWNQKLHSLLLPIVDSYEQEKINGSNLGIYSFASDAIRKSIKQFHAFRAAPAFVNSDNSNDIFKAIVKTKCGLEIMGSKDDDEMFAIVVKCNYYPCGAVATWVILGIDSVSPLHTEKSTK
ncbi:centrosomal protein [Histomonas meleagridis]|uniref:centrosomal protein of 76 kDa isoform X2 n=1 Tax=Histomonas meleagridis TaxID=135588 RepID=UPI00355A637C|nr:centrosomal protein [Histomonas meleagridis]KAH0797122.1 centrosomal protein of 76 kDa isoform X2 [Histomonas meleagridis]